MQPEITYGLVVPDADFERVEQLINESETKEIFVKDKSQITHRFYRENNEIYADKEQTDNTILKQKLMRMDEAQTLGMKDKFRTNVERRVKGDFPDLTEEEIRAHADVLTEANESIQRLIQSGMPKEIAVKLISLIIEGDQQFSTAEELAAFIKEVASPAPPQPPVNDGGELAEVVKNIIISSETL